MISLRWFGGMDVNGTLIIFVYNVHGQANPLLPFLTLCFRSFCVNHLYISYFSEVIFDYETYLKITQFMRH